MCMLPQYHIPQAMLNESTCNLLWILSTSVPNHLLVLMCLTSKVQMFWHPTHSEVPIQISGHLLSIDLSVNFVSKSGKPSQHAD